MAAPPASRAAGTSVLRVGATGNDTAAEVYYAQERGLFRKHGLDVRIVGLRNGAAQAAAVAGGALEIGEQNVVSMAHAHVRGIPFIYIAPAGEYSARASTTSLVVARASALRDGKDFAGKSVAVNALGDLTQIGASAWIDRHGGDSTGVRFIEMPAAQIGAAVARGTVDAGVIPEPSLTAALAAGQVRVLAQPYDALAPRFMINGWFANADWVRKNPDAARAFAAAVREAGAWANAHPDDSAKILEGHAKLDPTVVTRMRRATYGDRFDAASLQTVLDDAVRYKGLDRTIKAGELFDADI